MNVPNDCTGEAKIFTPALGTPPSKEGLESDLRLRVQAIVTEETVVGRKGKNDLGRTSNEVTAGLLLLNATQETKEVG